MSTAPPPAPAPADAITRLAAAPAAAPAWSSAQLLRGGREAVIAHQGALYRLRLTASGKLILTK